jgi:Arf-GAP with GTPase, ANK repeat and PH domain-containing protein 1/3/4/5/6/9/11
LTSISNFSLNRQHGLSSSSHHLPINKANSDLSSLDGSQTHSPLTKCSTMSSQGQGGGFISLLGENNNSPKFIQHERASHQPPASLENLQLLGLMPPKEKELPTPTSTPTTTRKSRRRSNLFIPSSKKEDKLKNSELGSGRSIPLKQGYLYKRSSKTLNKEWKKKYVTLCDDGKLTYHPSLHDYMDDVHGKEIPLQYVTVKVPGQKPRGSRSIITNSALTKNVSKNGINNNNINNNNSTTNSITEGIGMLSLLKDRKSSNEKVLLTAYDNLKEPGKGSSQSGDESGIALSNSNSQSFIGSDGNNKNDSQTPNVKKRHRRMKSSGLKNDVEGESNRDRNHKLLK